MPDRIRREVFLIVAATLTLGGCRTVHSDGDWEELAAVTADQNVDHAIVELRNEGKFRALRLEATGAPFVMDEIRVTFGNGEVFVPSMRLHFEEGSWIREIDLPGKHRHVRRIEFWYKGTEPGGQTRIVVRGLH
jgi:hypothetical protein